MILSEVGHIYGHSQPYLESLYRAMFALAYYGLMHISEVTNGPHAIKAKDVLVAQNKNKIRIILYSSKTHNKEDIPQEIKISASEPTTVRATQFFCPFTLMRSYMEKRGPYCHDTEEFFVFTDTSPVQQHHARAVLKEALVALNLNFNCYNFQCYRIGRYSYLWKLGYSLEHIKHLGRWRSNAVYRYLRNL